MGSLKYLRLAGTFPGAPLVVSDTPAALSALPYRPRLARCRVRRAQRAGRIRRTWARHLRGNPFKNFAQSIERMHGAQLSNPTLQFAFRSNVFVTYRSSTVTQCRDRAKLEIRNVRRLCPLPEARKSILVLTRESVPSRNSSLGRNLSAASSCASETSEWPSAGSRTNKTRWSTNGWRAVTSARYR